MPLAFSKIPILAVWEPIHRDDWGPDQARHFLERAGFGGTREQIEEVTELGPEQSCDKFFAPQALELPEWFADKLAEFRSLGQQAKEIEDREERQEIYRERNQVGREIILELEFEWLLRASQPKAGFCAKWELFLSDVWVVGKRAANNPHWQISYWQSLAESAHLPYPEFCKNFSREPAMMRYLDLDKSSKKKPNENFARELLELFALGEGNYSENDIKEAARAFTGRRIHGSKYQQADRQYDDGVKTVFARRGHWNGDEVIDIVFQQPAARTFLPSEAIRYYLTQEPIPEDQLKYLGDLWADEGFRLDALRKRLFSSRAFYAPDFQGTRIKSPVELYVGALQQFGLQPAPLPNRTSRPLRDMGQELFEPPNVRGWIGGEAWINAGKLAARRRMIDLLFTPIPFKRLNADDKIRVEREAEREGSRPFFVTRDALLNFTGRTSAEVSAYIQEVLLSEPLNESSKEQITHFLGEDPSPEQIETVIITTLQSPQYQLS